MPDGRTHNNYNCIIFTWLISLMLIILVMFYRYSISYLVDSIIYCSTINAGFGYAVFMFSPDMDQDEHRPDKYWWKFKFLTYPYARFFKHRGTSNNELDSMSHHWLLGTPGRFIYSIIFIIPFTIIFVIMILQSKYYIDLPLCWLFGMYISDWTHIFLDFKMNKD